MKCVCFIFFAVCSAFSLHAAPVPGTIVCEGEYTGGHVQGVATDGKAIYWSFTEEIVKTDLTGRRLAVTRGPSHEGDLCVCGDRVCVAVNRGEFNFENRGKGEVRVYRADTLELVKVCPLPELRHGAGGMTCRENRFFVVGGLPATHEKNYVYEYDADFRFVRRHDLDTGFTWMGIQTAAFEDGRFLFGIYGDPGDPYGVITCPPDFASHERFRGQGCCGILKLDGLYYVAMSSYDKATKTVRGRLVPQPDYLSEKTRCVLRPTNKGRVIIFFEKDSPTGWVDSGYQLEENGYMPLFHPKMNGIYTKVSDAAKVTVCKAVGIGGGRVFSVPDLVRGVRRVAENDEIIAFHVPGSRGDAGCDAKAAAAVAAIEAEAKFLGVRLTYAK